MKHQWPCGCMARWGRPTGRSGTAPHAAAFSPAWADDTSATAPLWSPVVLLPPRKQGVKPIRNTCYPLAPDVPMRGRDLRTPRRYVSWGCRHVAPCRWSNIPETFFHQKQWAGGGGSPDHQKNTVPELLDLKYKSSWLFIRAEHIMMLVTLHTVITCSPAWWNHTVSCSAQVLKISI